jgi:hypothetical protein
MIVSSFIIQANVITIVNYDRKTFIVQATGGNVIKILMAVSDDFVRSSL